MAIRLHRPNEETLNTIAEVSAAEGLTYGPIGVTAAIASPPGYRRVGWTRHLGNTDDIFRRASQALRDWEMHRQSGLIVAAARPPHVDQIVAMAAPLPVGFIDVVCRVVAVQDSDSRFGFTYGTLPNHPEQGEESFTVCRADDGQVKLEIVAVSRSRHPLARAAPPIARTMQRRATHRYLDAMQALVTV